MWFLCTRVHRTPVLEMNIMKFQAIVKLGKYLSASLKVHHPSVDSSASSILFVMTTLTTQERERMNLRRRDHVLTLDLASCINGVLKCHCNKKAVSSSASVKTANE